MDWGGAKAIETRYAGVRFRSRLEARWAVFMDALGVRWEYEPEGFDLGGLRYLPDFLLSDLDCWVEVKPEDVMPTEVARSLVDRASRLACASGKPVAVLLGSADALRTFEDGGSGVMFVATGSTPRRPTDFTVVAPVDWAVCLECGTVGLSDGSEMAPLPCGHRAFGSTGALEAAFAQARAWRAWEGPRT